MKDILSSHGLAVLRQYASSKVLVALDFDGTLAPICTGRDEVRMCIRTTALLERVCRQFPCVLVSGRARSDVLERVRDVSMRHVVGNHGIEPSDDQERCELWVRRVLVELECALGRERGVEIENKRYSLSLHYAQAMDRVDARRAIRAAVEALPEAARVSEGKGVVNLAAPGAPDKGDAVLRLSVREQVEQVIYVGDDETDEDVFRRPMPLPLLGIRVGSSSTSSASHYLRDQSQMPVLLGALLAARETALGRGRI